MKPFDEILKTFSDSAMQNGLLLPDMWPCKSCLQPKWAANAAVVPVVISPTA